MALALSVELYRASDKAHELQRNRPEIKPAASATKQSQFTIRQPHNEFNKKERIIFKIGSIKSESTDLKSNLNCTKKNKKSKKTNLKKQQIFCFFSSLVFFFFFSKTISSNERSLLLFYLLLKSFWWAVF